MWREEAIDLKITRFFEGSARVLLSFLIFVIMWFRWTFPRLRIDQLLNLEWKYLLPISMFNLLLATAIAILKWHF